MQPYRARFQGTGVVLVGVAQERASGWAATKVQRGRGIHVSTLHPPDEVSRTQVFDRQVRGREGLGHKVIVADPNFAPM